MIKKAIGLTLVFGLALASSVLAVDKGPGCGPGKVIMEGNSGILFHSSATTTDDIIGGGWGNLLAMTSGTSGCDTDEVIQRDEFLQQQFVANNLESLSEEMAQGRGEHLYSLAGLMGCSSAVYSDLGSVTQQKFESLFPTVTTLSTDLLSGLKREIAAHPKLAGSCTRIS